MHRSLIVLIVSILFSVTGCFPKNDEDKNALAVSEIKKISISDYNKQISGLNVKYRIAANDEKDCVSQGGIWDYFSKGNAIKGIKQCVYVSKDAGKSCSDGSQCESGVCSLNNGTAVCSKYAPNGLECPHIYEVVVIKGEKTRLTDCMIID